MKDYVADVVVDGFIKYFRDKIGEITLGVIIDNVIKHKELVKK